MNYWQHVTPLSPFSPFSNYTESNNWIKSLNLVCWNVEVINYKNQCIKHYLSLHEDVIGVLIETPAIVLVCSLQFEIVVGRGRSAQVDRWKGKEERASELKWATIIISIKTSSWEKGAEGGREKERFGALLNQVP